MITAFFFWHPRRRHSLAIRARQSPGKTARPCPAKALPGAAPRGRGRGAGAGARWRERGGRGLRRGASGGAEIILHATAIAVAVAAGAGDDRCRGGRRGVRDGGGGRRRWRR